MLHRMEYWTFPECKTAYTARDERYSSVYPYLPNCWDLHFPVSNAPVDSWNIVRNNESSSQVRWPPTATIFPSQQLVPPTDALATTQKHLRLWEKEGEWNFPIPGRVKHWVNLQRTAHPVWGPWGWSNLSVSHITEYTLFYRMLVSNSLPNIESTGSVIHNIWKWDELLILTQHQAMKQIWHWNGLGFSAIDLDSEERCCVAWFHFHTEHESQSHFHTEHESLAKGQERERETLLRNFQYRKRKRKGTQPKGTQFYYIMAFSEALAIWLTS